MRRLHMLRAFIVIFVVSLLLLLSLAIQESQAQILLSTQGGETIWFHRTCREVEPQEVGKWTLAPGLRTAKPKGLKFKIENAYPGYQIQCTLYLANVGNAPAQITNLQANSPRSGALRLVIQQPSAEKGKILYPCKFVPAWGTSPAKVPASCRTMIEVTLRIQDNIAQGIHYFWTISVNIKQ